MEFCNSLIETFEWERNELNSYLDKPQDFIMRLLETLLELNEKKLLDNHCLSGNNGEDRLEEFIGIFHKHKIHSPSVIHWMNNIEKKISILINEENREAIIETMIKTEYFTKLSIN